jgi:hypothetical protein
MFSRAPVVDMMQNVRNRRNKRINPINSNERAYLARFFKSKIHRAVVIINSIGGDSPEATEMVLGRAYGVLDGLQEACKHATGCYRRCITPLVRYTKDQRLEAED